MAHSQTELRIPTKIKSDGMQFKRENLHNLSLINHPSNSSFKTQESCKNLTTSTTDFAHHEASNDQTPSSHHISRKPISADARKSQKSHPRTRRVQKLQESQITGPAKGERIQTTNTGMCKPTCEAGPVAEEAITENGREGRTHGAAWRGLRARGGRPPHRGKLCEQSCNPQARRHEPGEAATIAVRARPAHTVDMCGHGESGTTILSAIATPLADRRRVKRTIAARATKCTRGVALRCDVRLLVALLAAPPPHDRGAEHGLR